MIQRLWFLGFFVLECVGFVFMMVCVLSEMLFIVYLFFLQMELYDCEDQDDYQQQEGDGSCVIVVVVEEVCFVEEVDDGVGVWYSWVVVFEYYVDEIEYLQCFDYVDDVDEED